MATETIRFARLDESSAAVSIWKEAANWLIERHQPLWPPELFTLTMAESHVMRGELVLAFKDDEPCAAMLVQTSDAVCWSERTPGSALYIHKLAVRRRHAGHKWPEKLLAWAAVLAAPLGVPLRLDCASRPGLEAVYTRCGFRRVDPGPVVRDGFEVLRLERPFDG